MASSSQICRRHPHTPDRCRRRSCHLSRRYLPRIRVATGVLPRCGSGFHGTEKNQSNVGSPKRKRTNFRWPSMGINYSANRPDPDDPGGLGAEESGVERTGPTQGFLVAIQKGGRWAEVGRYYDSTNDPVTVCVRSEIQCRRSVACQAATGLLQRRSVGAIMSVR